MISRQNLALYGGSMAHPSSKRVRVVSPGASLIGQEEIQAVTNVLRRQILYRHWGQEVSLLEKELAQRISSSYVVAVNSGTSALSCAFAALGIGSNDEVIVPCYSFIGVASAVLSSGATPSFCEIDKTLTLSVDDVSNLINKRTKAIVAVHMRGAPCEMDALEKLCYEHQIHLIEDVSQSCGASFKGKPLGTYGSLGCFSLQHFKVITTGEGGFLVTKEPELFKRIQFQHDASAFWANNGTSVPNIESSQVALNLRMGELEGALGRVQLGKLDSIIFKLRDLKERLIRKLSSVPGFERRTFHDAEGEVALALMLQIDKALPVKEIEKAVIAEGVEASLLLPSQNCSPERHFCEGWGKILGAKRLIGENRCNFSRSLLNRTLQIQIDPNYSIQDIDEIAEGVRKVFHYFVGQKKRQ